VSDMFRFYFDFGAGFGGALIEVVGETEQSALAHALYLTGMTRPPESWSVTSEPFESDLACSSAT
jgi:hypothetical protein